MWTEEQDKLLIDLWQQGIVGSIIADRVGKTRSAIMGRIKRLRGRGAVLRERPRYTPEEAVERKALRDAIRYRKKKPRALPYTPVKNKPRTGFKDAVLRALERPIIPDPPVSDTPYRDPCDIMDLRFFSCRYIVQDKPTLYCNQIVHKHSYCEKHFMLCYQAGTNKPLTSKAKTTPHYRR